jgi:hypothetical protein
LIYNEFNFKDIQNLIHEIEYIQKLSLLGITKAPYPNLGSFYIKGWAAFYSIHPCTCSYMLLHVLPRKALGEILEVYLEDTSYS